MPGMHRWIRRSHTRIHRHFLRAWWKSLPSRACSPKRALTANYDMGIQNGKNDIPLWGQERLGERGAILAGSSRIARRFQQVKTMRKSIPARGFGEATKCRASFQNSEYPIWLKCWECECEL